MSLSCERCRECLADGEQSAELALHLRTCEACRTVAASLGELDGELASLPFVDAPEALVEKTLERVRADQARGAQPEELGSRSLLAAAFGALGSALGALFLAPLVAARWLLGLGRPRGASTSADGAPRDGGAVPQRARSRGWVTSLVLVSALCAVVGLATFQRSVGMIKGKIDGSTSTLDAMPTGGEGGGAPSSFERAQVQRAPAGAPAVAAVAPMTATGRDRTPSWSGLPGASWRNEPAEPESPEGYDDDGRERTEHERLAEGRPGSGAFAALVGGEGERLRDETTRQQRGEPGYLQGDLTQRESVQGDADGWHDTHRTSGLRFAARDGWWENRYVPGDAAMRVLHARLAASTGNLSGLAFSPLTLAETSAPTVPAVAAPTDRAIALGVHADVASIEGPTRVRMEVAIRGIAQAAGRRGTLRVALVIDARRALDEAEQARVRALVSALSRSMSARDRVMLVSAGDHGGTLVELDALRAGPMEVALRHLFAGDGASGATTLESAVEGALEGVASDEGAGLVLLVTPDGAHDAELDHALRLGALAGVATSAVGIGSGIALADLDAVALAGQGRRALVLSDADAARTIRSELRATARLVARALRLRVRLAPGVELLDVLGSRPLDTEESRRERATEQAIDLDLARRLGIGADRDEDDDGIRILLPSFYAGDSHTVLLDLLVTRPGPVADVDVRFKDLVRLDNGAASSSLALESGSAPRGPHEERVVASFLGHQVASALETAGDRLAASDWMGARASLEGARALLSAARAEVPGLATSPALRADEALLDRYLSALGTGSPAVISDSLHYAAHRRIVLPQLTSTDP